MVTFKLRIFTSCQTSKHSSTPPEHSSPPSQRHESITADSPPPSKQAPRRSFFKSHTTFAFRRGSGSVNQSFANVLAKLFDVISPRPKTSNSAIAGAVSDNGHGFRFTRISMPPFYRRRNCHHRKDIGNLRTGLEPKVPDNLTSSSARFSTSYTLEERPDIMSNPRKSFSDVGMRSRGLGGEASEWGSPARLSALMPCKMEGKVKESFAVVKRSKKPYEDFKKSLMEMIVENEIYEESDLKQLLHCFLSLNSWYHHGVIMEAFLEIWNTMHVS